MITRPAAGALVTAALCLLPDCSPRPARAPSQAADTVQSRIVQGDTIAAGSPQWRIVPGHSAGPLTAGSSEADLRQHYGAAEVRPTRVEIGEGETMPGAVLFPGDSSRRMEILWQDTTARRRPARLILRGSKSEWWVGPNISLGTSLQDLERLNGRPFTLAGFGWDYAGVVTDWNGGKLDSALTSIKLYLDPGPAQYESAPYSQMVGDRDYSSSLPAMQQLSPKVAQIYIDFAP